MSKSKKSESKKAVAQVVETIQKEETTVTETPMGFIIKNVYFPSEPGKPRAALYINDEGKLDTFTKGRLPIPCTKFQLVMSYTGYAEADDMDMTTMLSVGQYENRYITEYEDKDGTIVPMEHPFNPLRTFIYKALSQFDKSALGTDKNYTNEMAIDDLKFLMAQPEGINFIIKEQVKDKKNGGTYTVNNFIPVYKKVKKVIEQSDM